jgi:hypothetical protein
MTELLLARPRYDDTTDQLFEFAETVRLAAETDSRHACVDLPADLATRANFRAQILSKQLIIFYGHGTSRTLVGQGGHDLLLAVGDDVGVRGAVIYAAACNAALELGGYCVSRGAQAFVGYSDELGLVRESAAAFFRDAINALPLELLADEATSTTFPEGLRRARSKFDGGPISICEVLDWEPTTMHLRRHGFDGIAMS